MILPVATVPGLVIPKCVQGVVADSRLYFASSIAIGCIPQLTKRLTGKISLPLVMNESVERLK